MIAVITGDIVNSRELSNEWIDKLKNALNGLPKGDMKWEIFRGDSFQIEIGAAEALLKAIYIKACMKTLIKADVRMGIGIGAKTINSAKVTESNGEAFINSGYAFDTLKMLKMNMAFQTPWDSFTDDMNLYIRLALIVMDNWSPKTAEMVKYTIENRDIKQDKIAKISGKSQSSVSEALKRAHYTEVMELENKYRNSVLELIKI